MNLHAGIAHYVHDYGYAAVSLGLLLEHFGLPLPGETMLIGSAVLASQGEFDIRLLLVLAWASATVGNTIGYAIGRYGGHWLVMRHGEKIGITRDKFAEVEALFARYGDAIIVGARFIVLLRQLSGIAAGTLEMGWTRFLVFNALGAALWVGCWGVLSYWLGRRIFAYLAHLGGIEYVLFAIAALLALTGAHLRLRRRAKENTDS
jgi:membrane protein DedA with SNARE-associated domain